MLTPYCLTRFAKASELLLKWLWKALAESISDEDDVALTGLIVFLMTDVSVLLLSALRKSVFGFVGM